MFIKKFEMLKIINPLSTRVLLLFERLLKHLLTLLVLYN